MQPRQLRGSSGRELISGYKYLHFWEKRQLKEANMHAENTAAMLHLCVRLNIPFIYEQPAPGPGQPHMTNLPAFVSLQELPGVFKIFFML